MEFTEVEKQILITICLISRRKTTCRENLEEYKEKIFREKLKEWGKSLDDLISRGIICEEDDTLAIAEPVRPEAWDITYRWESVGFSDWLTKSHKSQSYSKFCEKLYGKDLCQCSMMDMKQLEKLLELLALDSDSRVLDIACGVGGITEYIGDITGAAMTGIDFASAAIEMARKRTGAKADRLTFQVQNLDNIDFPERSFDAVICVDALSFVTSLDDLFARCKEILAPNGQMGLFYSQIIAEDEPRNMLLADGTTVAQALRRNDLEYVAWDFTPDEYDHWRRSREIAEELRHDFEDEGYLELYESRVRESDRLLEVVDAKRISRFLYHVKL